MRRRDFIKGIVGSAVTARPSTARAQRPAMPVIGFLHSGSPEPNVNRVAAFRKGLSEAGYVEGQNVTIEYRWAVGQDDRLADLAADLIRRRVAVIATPGSPSALLAAKAATTTIPIVFLIGRDPVALGLVASLNRPGGNATGVYLQLMELVAKGLGLLRELAQGANRFVVLVNPNTAYTDVVVKDLEASALALGLPIEILRASTGREIDAAFANLVQKPGCALFVVPVVQPTKFELVVNLNTARALGLTIPPSLLARDSQSGNSNDPNRFHARR